MLALTYGESLLGHARLPLPYRVHSSDPEGDQLTGGGYGVRGGGVSGVGVRHVVGVGNDSAYHFGDAVPQHWEVCV